MSNKPRELPMSLGFYEALNGEFKAPCDPEARTLTLASLIMTVIENGVSVSLGKKEYTPHWATEVTAEVVLAAKQQSDRAGQVLWLGLHGPHRDLSFTHDNSRELVVVTSSGLEAVDVEFELPASLRNSELLPQSSAIASSAAEAFFDIPIKP